MIIWNHNINTITQTVFPDLFITSNRAEHFNIVNDRALTFEMVLSIIYQILQQVGIAIVSFRNLTGVLLLFVLLEIVSNH